MARAGLEPSYLDAPHDAPWHCVEVALEALRGPSPPTALVAADDAVALTLLSQPDVEVPGRLWLVGFDDIGASALVRPRLTTVGVDKEAMGRMAVTLLRHRVAHPDDPACTQVQHARLVVRESTAPPAC